MSMASIAMLRLIVPITLDWSETMHIDSHRRGKVRFGAELSRQMKVISRSVGNTFSF